MGLASHLRDILQLQNVLGCVANQSSRAIGRTVFGHLRRLRRRFGLSVLGLDDVLFDNDHLFLARGSISGAFGPTTPLGSGWNRLRFWIRLFFVNFRNCFHNFGIFWNCLGNCPGIFLHFYNCGKKDRQSITNTNEMLGTMLNIL